MGRLTHYQAHVLKQLIGRPHTLREDDECDPPWWVEAGPCVRKSTAVFLRRRGYIEYTKRLGGLPGTLCYSITDAGRMALTAALAQAEAEGRVLIPREGERG